MRSQPRRKAGLFELNVCCRRKRVYDAFHSPRAAYRCRRHPRYPDSTKGSDGSCSRQARVRIMFGARGRSGDSGEGRMRWLVATGAVGLVAVAPLAAWLLVPWHGAPPEIAAACAPARREYVPRLGCCVTCHTDEENGGAFLAGGRAVTSPFGTFYAPNITPDPATGIGGWSTGAFVRAMTEGIGPDGHPYFPAFPYTSYTRMQ